MRDLTDDENLQASAHEAIFQKGNQFKGIPERVRMEFLIRDQVGDFIQKVVCEKGGTDNK